MSSPFDDLDRKKLDEIHRNVKLLNEQVARIQEQLDRKYLRLVISRQRTKLLENKGYISQLENELRLRGLE